MMIAVICLAQTTKAITWQYLPENLSLVQENLNKDLYSFNTKIVNFSISKNRATAHLQIMNNICPEANGEISCLAMPAIALNAAFTIAQTETEIDSCGVQIMTSNTVDVGSRWAKDRRRFAQIKIKDYSKSTCEMVYVADVEVELQDTTMDTVTDIAQIHNSTMLFNYPKVSGPVAQ